MREYAEYQSPGLDFVEQIPAHWNIVPFGRVFTESREVNGENPVGPMLSVSGYRGVEVKEYDSENRRRTPEEVATYRVVRQGQLAVNTMWLNYAGLGVSEFEGHMSPAYRAYDISPFLEPRYVHHLLRSSTYVQGYTALLTGIRPNSLQMSRDDLMSFPVILPPLEEQRLIADYLDRETSEIDAFINDQQSFRRLLIERWVSGLVSVVQPQLLEQDPVHVRQLRPSWTRTRLKSTVESEKNGSWGSEEGVDQVTRRCIRVADFDKHSGRIHGRSETNRSYPIDQANSLALKAGDLLIEKSGGGPTSPVGNVVLYTGPGGDLCSNFVDSAPWRGGIRIGVWSGAVINES